MKQNRQMEKELSRNALRARRWKLFNRLLARFMRDPFGNRLDRPRDIPTRQPHFYYTYKHTSAGIQFEKVMATYASPREVPAWGGLKLVKV